jgi:1-acyl-sn-glycerol-3-phosphate acyltransferase
VFFAKEELWRIGWLAWVGRAHGDICVRRGEADRQAIRDGEDRLAKGLAVAILPEGTRSKSDALGPGQPGAAFLALRKGVPILPYGIWGAERLRKPTDALRRPKIDIRFGEPFVLDPALRKDLPAATEQIMRSIAALLPPAYRGAYGE